MTRAPAVARSTPAATTATIAPKVLGKAWEKKLDGEGRPPAAWKQSRPSLPKGSDAANRFASLKAEDGLAPTEVFKNPANGSFALRSQTDGESDARLYVYDASGKELWAVDVADDGTRSGGPATPIVPFTKPTGPTDSLAGNAAAIARVKAEVGAKVYRQEDWVDVPKTKLSQTWTPEESRLLPDAVVSFSRKLSKQAGDTHTVHKLLVDKHPIYVVHDERGWERVGSTQELTSKQVAWAFDASGNLLASGSRLISTKTSPDVRNTRSASGAYTWDATPRLPTAR